MTTTVIDDVLKTAEAIKSDAMQRFPEAASVGDAVRQGDVYFTLLDGVPKSAAPERQPALQLAPGSTQGSRHCLDSLDGVTVYRLPAPAEYDGPILNLATERTITHPEHGDWVLPPGVYAVSYQRTVDSEQRIRRVQD